MASQEHVGVLLAWSKASDLWPVAEEPGFSTQGGDFCFVPSHAFFHLARISSTVGNSVVHVVVFIYVQFILFVVYNSFVCLLCSIRIWNSTSSLRHLQGLTMSRVMLT